MILYLLTRTDKVGWDEYISMVVAADSAEEARKMEPPGGWAEVDTIHVKRIGQAGHGITGIVHDSFNAG